MKSLGKLGFLWRLFPYGVLLITYILFSMYMTQENPDQRVVPSLPKLLHTAYQYAVADQGPWPILWLDTYHSLTRILLGLLISSTVGLLLGLSLGLLKTFRYIFSPLVAMISVVPAIAILPIIFIAIGVGESAIILLVFIGTFLSITRDVELSAQLMPSEYLTKAMTMGANKVNIFFNLMLPMILPRLLNSVRVTLGAAWIFTIIAESLIGDVGLGFRIFLVRRYLAMDVILVYIVWIALLGLAMDRLLALIIRWRFRWYENSA